MSFMLIDGNSHLINVLNCNLVPPMVKLKMVWVYVYHFGILI